MALQALKNIKSEGSNAPKGFPALLEQYKGEIAKALPKHLNPDRMARVALTAFRMNPRLGECDPRSVFAAIIQSSQLGLEVGLSGEAHLVPFKSECQLVPGYQGLMKLARNSGLVADIYGHPVRSKDKFSMKLGLQKTLNHEPFAAAGGFPAAEEERGELVGFYAVAVLSNGIKTFEPMSRASVERIRDRSRGYQAAKRNNRESPWDTDFEAMGLKTVIRRLCKYLPKSPELALALELDNATEDGRAQGLDLNSVIDGSYVPVTDEANEPADAA